MRKEELTDKLIDYLMSEDKRFAGLKVPLSYDDKRIFLRGLINMRLPKWIDENILGLEDELLNTELSEKKITDVNDIKVNEGIGVWLGDITELRIQAIVNAGNSGLLGCFVPNHFCIDNAIHTYAGIRLRLECAKIMKGREAETGDAIITKSYNLPCEYVIHTVGPIAQENLTLSDKEKLRTCYKNCLDLALKYKIRTIAFPAISTGLFGFPKDEASRIAVHTVKEYLKEHPGCFDKVIFNVFSKEDKSYYDRLL